MLAVTKESMIIIIVYMLHAKNARVHDLLNTIKKIEKKYWKKLEFIVKIIKTNLNETEKLLTHARKIYKIFTIRLTP